MWGLKPRLRQMLSTDDLGDLSPEYLGKSSILQADDFLGALKSLNGGLANEGLRYLSTIAYDCRHFATKVPLRKGPKRATSFVHNCRRLCANCREWP